MSSNDASEISEEGGNYAGPLWGMACLWAIIIAVFWNTISSAFLRDVKVTGLAILAGSAQVLLIGLGIYSLLYRKSVLRLHSKGVVGERFRGVIIYPKGLSKQTERTFKVRLRCVKWVQFSTGHKRNEGVEKEIWQHTELVRSALNVSSSNFEIPVNFHIPNNCEPTGPLSSKTQFLWFLEIVGCVPVFKVAFKVPVAGMY